MYCAKRQNTGTCQHTTCPELIGFFRNEWRGRDVSIYKHPTDPKKVITQGVPFGDTKAVIETEEPREDFANWIGRFNGVFK